MSRRAKFIELAEARTDKATKMIRLIGNLSNRSAYDYTEEEYRKIFKHLHAELEAAKARFAGSAGDKSQKFKL